MSVLRHEDVEYTRIIVTLPNTLVSELDQLIVGEKCSRSHLVHRVLSRYVDAQRQFQIEMERLRNGYEEMALINLALAEEGLPADDDDDVPQRD